MKKLILATIIFLLLQINLYAQNNNPIEVKVGVYVIGISKISTNISSYSLDFYLTLTCNRQCEKEKDYKFEIINGRAISIKLTDDQPNFKVYRINAELFSSFDFKPYPFDKPQLTLIIEDELFDNSKLIYKPDLEKTAIDAQIPSFGWDVNRINSAVTEHNYPNFKQDFSSYKFSITLSRPFWSSVLRMLPAVAIMLACLIAFVMTASFADRGFTLITSSLVASVLFHANLASGVPQIPYLTFADRVMLLNYLIIVVCLAIIGITLTINKTKPEKAEKLQKSTRILVPILWLILQLINIFI